jgi:hypothetical protein
MPREGGPVKSENDPVDPDPPHQLRQTLEAIRYLESTLTTSSEFDGIVVRAGSNAKAKRLLLWQPKHASWRQGSADVLTQSSDHQWPRPG